MTKTIESDSDYSKNEAKGNVMRCHFWWTWACLYLLKIFGHLRVWEDMIYTARMICVWLVTGEQRQVTFEWQSIVQALLKNSLYTCSFQFQGPTIVVGKLWGCPRLCEGFSVQLMEIDCWYPPADPWSTDRI